MVVISKKEDIERPSSGRLSNTQRRPLLNLGLSSLAFILSIPIVCDVCAEWALDFNNDGVTTKYEEDTGSRIANRTYNSGGPFGNFVNNVQVLKSWAGGMYNGMYK